MKLRTRGAKPFGALLDSRVIYDPWGLGLALEIIRDGIEAWQVWLKGNSPDSPEVREYLAALWQLNTANNRGGRLKTKLTEEEIQARAAQRAAAKIDLSARSEALARLKPGLATVAILRIVEGESAHVRCTACGNRWELDQDGEPCPKCGDLAYVDDPEPIPSTPENIAALLANTTDAEGRIRYLGKYDEEDNEVPFGDQAVGDAIAAWVLDEMAATEKFRADAVAAVKEVFRPGLPGPTGNGSSSPQASAPRSSNPPADSSAPAIPGTPAEPSIPTPAASTGSLTAAGGAEP